jgi:membrane protein
MAFHLIKRTKHKVQQVLHDIWTVNDESTSPRRAHLYRLLRILNLVISGIGSNKIVSRAAALSYSSLIAMGPLLAIMFLVSSWFYQGRENVMMEYMNNAAVYLFPQLGISEGDEILHHNRKEPVTKDDLSPKGLEAAEAIEDHGTEELHHEPSQQTSPNVAINPAFLSLIENFVSPSRSGAITSIGIAALIVISIQLLISVETAFNQIWGIQRGREWSQRIVFYWAFLSLGVIVSIAAITLLSVGTIAGLIQKLPFAEAYADTLLKLIRWMAPIASFFLLVAILTGFYRFIPNTTVHWTPAITGAIIVALFLILNQYFSFLYVQQVVRFKSLYGYTAIIPILMVGMYIFWIFILIGGQITYSVQNADFLSKKEAWNNTSEATRELLGLAILIQVAQKFRECLAPVSLSELATQLRVPGKVLNECLTRLVDIHLINPVSLPNHEGEIYYQPARPLQHIYLSDFKLSFERYGNNDAAELISDSNGLLKFYRTKVSEALKHSIGSASLEELLANCYPSLPENKPVV